MSSSEYGHEERYNIKWIDVLISFLISYRKMDTRHTIKSPLIQVNVLIRIYVAEMKLKKRQTVRCDTRHIILCLHFGNIVINRKITSELEIGNAKIIMRAERIHYWLYSLQFQLF